MNLNNGQKEAVKSILSFLKSKNKMFLLEGYAGTGKSTIITYLLKNNHFSKKKIAMTATTNKAVSVLESLSNFESKNIHFMTIHRLLKFKRKIDESGNIQYLSSLNEGEWILNHFNSIYYYDIIIIDEASMINQSMLKNILYISNTLKGKIIFLGDIAQLPPINEESSDVFSIDIPKSKLTEIMRNKNSVTNLANKIRIVIDNQGEKIQLKNYKGDNFKVVKDYDSFYNEYINIFRKKEKAVMVSYTNNQCNINNNTIRQKLFDTSDKYVVGDLIVFNGFYQNGEESYFTSQQEYINDICTQNISITKLNFNSLLNLKAGNKLDDVTLINKSGLEIMCPICYEDSVDFTVETKCNHYFCSSCINLWLKQNKECPYCRMSLVNSTNEVLIKDDKGLTELLIDLKNQTLDYSFKCYRITLGDGGTILVIHKDDEEKHKQIIKFIHQKLTNMKNYIEKEYKNNFSKILLNKLWEYFYQNFYDKFANISYGYCITVHKSQGSTFKYVFTDMRDIIKKNFKYKAKYQCLYTAITRTSETLYLLL